MTTASRRLIAIAAMAAAVTFAAPAHAAPDNGNTMTLDLSCADGQDYRITLLGRTNEGPAAHVVGSSSVLVPTAFQWHVLMSDAEGNVLDESTSTVEPVHGRSGQQLDTLTCTFTQFGYHDIPGVGPVTIQVDGTVWAFRPGVAS